MKKNLAIFLAVLVLIFLCVVFITLCICRSPSSELAQDPSYYQTLNNQVWTTKVIVILSFLVFVVLVTIPICVIYFILRKSGDRWLSCISKAHSVWGISKPNQSNVGTVALGFENGQAALEQFESINEELIEADQGE